MNWRVFVHYKPQFVDHRGRSLEKEWRAAGHARLQKVRAGQAYEISGDITEADLRALVEKLLTDPVTQTARLFPSEKASALSGSRLAEVWPKPGVSDPVAETVKLGARDLGLNGLRDVRSGAVYEFWGKAKPQDVRSFCEEHLMNPLVQKAEIQ